VRARPISVAVLVFNILPPIVLARKGHTALEGEGGYSKPALDHTPSPQVCTSILPEVVL